MWIGADLNSDNLQISRAYPLINTTPSLGKLYRKTAHSLSTFVKADALKRQKLNCL